MEAYEACDKVWQETTADFSEKYGHLFEGVTVTPHRGEVVDDTHKASAGVLRGVISLTKRGRDSNLSPSEIQMFFFWAIKASVDSLT